ncbi:hypothetical protein ACDF64_02470 [Agromyces sp. MMS24-JH15]|uniref:hypothetical protein n=1 Tax=Agromyces sp. MMS24-JH15 TaxID=3243765 RepID=UPI0037486CD5
MGFDAVPRAGSRHRYDTAAADRAAITRFLDDLAALELRLAMVGDRSDRLAGLPARSYDAWRRDTVGQAQGLAARAKELDATGAITADLRRRVGAALVGVRQHVHAIDARRAASGLD